MQVIKMVTHTLIEKTTFSQWDIFPSAGIPLMCLAGSYGISTAWVREESPMDPFLVAVTEKFSGDIYLGSCIQREKNSGKKVIVKFISKGI
jgi:hypothetical protein